MSQSLEIELKANSDVPQAMEKAKAATESFNKQVENIGKNNKKATQGTKEATTGFSKQVEDIQKKFSTSFKDIFLSFLGPMALLTTAIGLIGKMIADNQRKQEEANQAAIEGTNALMSAEDRYYANKLNNEKKEKQTSEEAATARAKITQDFLENDPRGRQIYDQAYREKFFGHPFKKSKPGLLKDDPEIQAQVQAIIAEDMKKNPLILSEFGKPKDTQFKGPEGFGTVIGVGANPVLEAMTKQVEVLQEIKVILEQSKPGGGVPPPFTEKPISLRGVFNA
jgi:hypothetical protein